MPRIGAQGILVGVAAWEGFWWLYQQWERQQGYLRARMGVAKLVTEIRAAKIPVIDLPQGYGLALAQVP